MIVAPSILSLDYSEFKKQLDILNKKVKWLHFDVMDGHFVPNLSFGPDIFRAFRTNSNLFLDVHLMVDDPFHYSEVFIKNGADGITFHHEVFNDIEKELELIEKIHSSYCKAGISIKPKTSIEEIYPLLDSVDLVLIMSVEPGFGGQSFIESSYDKIKALKQYKDEHNLDFLIEVDGGVSDKNAYRLVEAGCDVLVAGSFVFKGDLAANIDRITI